MRKEIKITPRGVRVYPSELDVIEKHYGTLQEFVAQKARAFAKAMDKTKAKAKAKLNPKSIKKKGSKTSHNKKAKKK